MYIIYLYILLLLPILQIIFINRNKYNLIKNLSLFWYFFFLIIYSVIWIFYDPNNQFQFLFKISWIKLNFIFTWSDLLLGVDALSLFFIGLSFILMPICVLISWNSVKFLLKEFIIFLHVILLFLIILFSVLELLSFYILFEIILIPIFLLIGIWGSREEKIEASFYFFFYTLIGSFLMLLSIFKLYSLFGNTNFIFLYHLSINFNLECMLFLGFFISLCIKIPMFPFHLWLPKAHVEAPISGSILLAGILLKLGGYGFLRLLLPLFSKSLNYYSCFLIILSLLSIIYAGLSTFRQNDLKKLIAYSSVSHMGIVTLCIFIASSEGLISAIIMMLAHGFISSAYFIFSFVLYARFQTRLIKYYKGLTISMPILSFLVLFLVLGNIGFPYTLNFITEFLAIKTTLNYSLFAVIILSLGCFISLVYSIFLYNRMFFGSISPYLKFCRDLYKFEFFSINILIFLTILFGILPNIIINLMTTQIYNFNIF